MLRGVSTQSPRTLSDLILQVCNEDGVTYQQIADRSGLRLSTIGAWAVGTRGTQRPPAPDKLRQLATGLRRPEAQVFEAAGRNYPSPDADVRERRHLHRYRELTEREKWLVDQHMQSIVESRERGDEAVSES